MRRRHRRPRNLAADLDITAFMNLMVILVPFLLITAVFSRMAVLELKLPDRGSDAAAEEQVTLQITVRQAGFDVGDSRGVVASQIPLLDGSYDYDTLAQTILASKAENPDEVSATVLLEPDIAYDVLIQVMDRLRLGPPDAQGHPGELFPAISLGPAALRPN